MRLGMLDLDAGGCRRSTQADWIRFEVQYVAVPDLAATRARRNLDLMKSPEWLTVPDWSKSSEAASRKTAKP